MGDLGGKDARPHPREAADDTAQRRRAPRGGRPPAHRLEGGLWLMGFGALAAAASAVVLPAAVARDATIDVAGPTLMDARVGYWILVGMVVLALLAVEAFLGWTGAWLAIVALGLAGLATAVAVVTFLPPAGEPLTVMRGAVAVQAPTRPGVAALALAIGGLAVAAGGVLMRPAGGDDAAETIPS